MSKKALMKEEAVKQFLRIYGKSIPLKKKFNFTGFCKDVKSLIDEDYNYLLMNKKDLLSKNKKREFLRARLTLEVNDINFKEKETLKTKRKNLLKKQKLMLSSHNNKMFLDLMLNNKRYIKYNKKFNTLNNFKNMNKKRSNYKPIDLKKLIKQNNTFFKTEIPKGNQINSQSLRNSLFNQHQKKNLKKYIIKSNFPTLNIDYNFNNFFKENENKKNDESIKTCFNYNKNSRRKINYELSNNNQSKKDSVEKNNYFIENNKNDKTPKKKSIFISNSNNIKKVKSNIFKVKFNPIKTVYKTQINI